MEGTLQHLYKLCNTSTTYVEFIHDEHEKQYKNVHIITYHMVIINKLHGLQCIFQSQQKESNLSCTVMKFFVIVNSDNMK